MHIVIAALGSIVTVLWLLHRLAEMGVSLGGLNPWLWRRRRKWRARYEANPVYAITSPMEMTALLVAATAKADGDMSSDEKQAILNLFEAEFHLSDRDAAALLTSSTHLLGQGHEVRDSLGQVLGPCKDNFTESQAASAVTLLERVAAVSGDISSLQQELIDQVKAELFPPVNGETDWS